jgi:quercetin dioxygenase-like cupin family protein
MRFQFARVTSIVLSSLAILGIAVATGAQSASQTPGTSSSSQHVAVPSAQQKWGPAPPSLPAGAQVAILKGDPAQPGPFAIAIKMPSGYTVPPHWHPTDENLVVIEGSLALGMGDSVNAAAETTLDAGGYSFMPKEMHHYAKAKAATTFVLYGTGPFAITYVNPADDPRGKTGPSSK